MSHMLVTSWWYSKKWEKPIACKNILEASVEKEFLIEGGIKDYAEVFEFWDRFDLLAMYEDMGVDLLLFNRWRNT